MIEKLIGSRLRTKLLGWLLSHSDESFFVRQMEQLIQENSTNISRELRRLEEMGIVQSEKRANLKYVKINQNCPFYKELKGLFLKTVGTPSREEIMKIEEILREFREEIGKLYGERLKDVILYGSWARGEGTEESDIDLLVLLEGKVIPGREIDRMIDIITEINLKYSVLLSVHPISEADYTTIKSPLLINVRREGRPA
jgi:predicted nucleotidyltransferase